MIIPEEIVGPGVDIFDDPLGVVGGVDDIVAVGVAPAAAVVAV